MAQAGNAYIITLKRTHLEWGTYRNTSSRELIYGEGYIPIPSHIAHSYQIYNSNYQCTGFGYNLFNCRSTDGYFEGVIKSSGCSTAGDIYAKQFHGNGDLTALGNWFNHCGAQEGDQVEVRWISPIDIVITHLPI